MQTAGLTFTAQKQINRRNSGTKIRIMIKNTTVRLPIAISEKLTEDFGNFSTATQLILETFEKLKKVNIEELKGYFTQEEITALADSQNGVMLSPDFIYKKGFLISQLEDFEKFESGISRHGADPATLLEKIEKLPSAQVYFLILDISAFWNTGGEIEQYIKGF